MIQEAEVWHLFDAMLPVMTENKPSNRLSIVRDDRPKPASEARWRRSGRSRGWASLFFARHLASETRVSIPELFYMVVRAQDEPRDRDIVATPVNDQ